MPLDVVRLRDSDIAALSSADEFRSAVMLWCASWHQVPAASLPDDDRVLAQLAGYGRVVTEWKRCASARCVGG
ncbi:YdaU family protein [Burkholderia glumae]|uniref:YdaU family protein n=1 Tax=Burkholderia glumae TaxID=337 RepID=UPI001F1D74C2|nr:YdaU family protein [Burkholderia glumae]